MIPLQITSKPLLLPGTSSFKLFNSGLYDSLNGSMNCGGIIRRKKKWYAYLRALRIFPSANFSPNGNWSRILKYSSLEEASRVKIVLMAFKQAGKNRSHNKKLTSALYKVRTIPNKLSLHVEAKWPQVLVAIKILGPFLYDFRNLLHRKLSDLRILRKSNLYGSITHKKALSWTDKLVW